MRYTNYIFDLYATLIDIHTDQNPIYFWRRITAIMDAYGAMYEPVELRTRYRQLIHEHEVSLENELNTEFPEIELGDVFKELLLSAPESRNDGIWGDPREWSGEVLDRWCSAFAYAFRVVSRIKFELYPDTIALLEELRREGKHVYLLSNAQSLFTRPEMDELGLTPYFEGSDLVARGVLIEAVSIEDDGDGIMLNRFCFNVQPGIRISYSDGSSRRE